MANTYTSLYYHVIFSTKNREPLLAVEVRERVWSYMAGIARANQMTPLKIGGVADHVHVLVSVPASLAIAKAVQLIKGGSSHWVRGSVPGLSGFAWQDGYGAFTVSESQIEAVRDYIRRQEEHHRRETFAEEYRDFLDRHQVAFDERYLLG
jgi:REP element-mobilizing transposase RayT